MITNQKVFILNKTEAINNKIISLIKSIEGGNISYSELKSQLLIINKQLELVSENIELRLNE